jgi:hypothetical protein
MSRSKAAIVATVAALSGLAAAGGLAGPAQASAATAAAPACRAWTGHHPTYAVRLSSVDVLSPCDVWATGVPGANTRSVTVTDLLHWNGATWTLRTNKKVPTSPLPPPSVTAVSAGNVWVAGSDGNTAGFAQTLIAHWNGIALTRVGSRNPGEPMGGDELAGISAAGADDVWAVGAYTLFDTNFGVTASLPLAQRWNGHAWVLVSAQVTPTTTDYPTPFGAFSAVTTVSGADAWAVGSYQVHSSAGTRQDTLAEHTTGGDWTISPTPNVGNEDQLSAVSAAGKDDVWAVGQYGDPAKTLVEHWNGAAWTIMPSPSPGRDDGKADGVLLGVAVVGPHDAWAVGSYVDSPHAGRPIALVLHWNGSSWRQVAVPHYGPAGAPNVLTAVSASSSGNVIAVGSYTGAGGTGQQALALRLP